MTISCQLKLERQSVRLALTLLELTPRHGQSTLEKTVRQEMNLTIKHYQSMYLTRFAMKELLSGGTKKVH